MKIRLKLLILSLAAFSLYSCKSSLPTGGFFGKRSPHELYSQNLSSAGLDKTALGRSWIQVAEQVLAAPLKINIPYRETGYFGAEKARAAAFRFEVKKGEKLSINLSRKPIRNFMIYADLFELQNSSLKRVASADTSSSTFSYEIDEDGEYVLRIQPELLASGEYTLTITRGPSLAFPVSSGRIGSFWGADRDGGARRHEGIDIFAPKRTPAIAAANGTVSRVTINSLGGKVIFLRPENKDFSLYYAHLDEQLVSTGDRVKMGDTIGLVGNTGNAASTSPHLHFGIYTFGGAIDPLRFVNPVVKAAPPVKASIASLGGILRASGGEVSLKSGLADDAVVFAKLPSGNLVEVLAAAENSYRVELPDGAQGFVSSRSLAPLNSPLRKLMLSKEKPLLDKPVEDAARKANLSAGNVVNILASFGEFHFVEYQENLGWVAKD